MSIVLHRLLLELSEYGEVVITAGTFYFRCDPIALEVQHSVRNETELAIAVDDAVGKLRQRKDRNAVTDREKSIALYTQSCPATYKKHDWRHATDAPGRRYGDECVRCEACQLKAIVPVVGEWNG